MQTKHLTIALALAIGISVPALAQQPNVAAGKVSFEAKCKACHLAPIAPPLKGVHGRKAGSVPGFAFYSDAMKAKNKTTWNDTTLSAYLTNPMGWAPGSKMAMAVPDGAERGNIIAYMKTLK